MIPLRWSAFTPRESRLLLPDQFLRAVAGIVYTEEDFILPSQIDLSSTAYVPGVGECDILLPAMNPNASIRCDIAGTMYGLSHADWTAALTFGLFPTMLQDQAVGAQGAAKNFYAQLATGGIDFTIGEGGTIPGIVANDTSFFYTTHVKVSDLMQGGAMGTYRPYLRQTVDNSGAGSGAPTSTFKFVINRMRLFVPVGTGVNF